MCNRQYLRISHYKITISFLAFMLTYSPDISLFIYGHSFRFHCSLKHCYLVTKGWYSLSKFTCISSHSIIFPKEISSMLLASKTIYDSKYHISSPDLSSELGTLGKVPDVPKYTISS